MSEKMFKEYVQSLLTVDGKGRAVKDNSLRRLMFFAFIMGVMITSLVHMIVRVI